MSDRSDYGDPEGTYLEDSADQLQPEDSLIDDEVADVLDRGYSPPDREPSALKNGRWDDATHDTIDERIEQEVPDPASAYGAPDNESGEQELLGGDDPDAIPAEDDWEGDGQVGFARAGRLVAEDEGSGEDTDADAWAEDVGVDGAGASAEEAAVHIIGESDVDLDLDRDLDIDE
ncbi:DUF5709 domain-containing protein [Millisia brevis]|uniref:DUF5709 domain-containing protein n=1 Tax=Millisia brevis TaxID=264148 RepID=UPI000832B030|nr:DUF5709 domain-containing protein [Millisia brevis]